jgi:prepilin signal peptidase PulO-like enzyme (type II secretory pathway)
MTTVTTTPTAAAPSNMPLITMVTGAASIALGVALAVIANSRGMNWATAAIPAYVGVLFVLLGAAARTPTLRKHLMHVAAMLALLLTLAGLGMGVPKLIRYSAGAIPPEAARPLAWWGQVAMAVIFAVFLVFAIRSFIAAKRWRQAHASA